MFCVINRKKVFSYIMVFVGFLSVICTSNYITNIAVTTAAGGERILPIYSVETVDKKVALTFDCAWSQERMG